MIETKVFTYRPVGKKAEEELMERVSVVHADAVMRYIRNLPYPVKDKLRLFSEVQSAGKNTEEQAK